jgi:hypothetical protein
MAQDKIVAYKSHSQQAAYTAAYDKALAETGSYRKVYEAVLVVSKSYDRIWFTDSDV